MDDAFCENCIKNFLLDKHLNRSKFCSSCRDKNYCIYCRELEGKDEALKVFQLSRKLLRERAACKEHMYELRIINEDVTPSFLILEDLSKRPAQDLEKYINEVGKIIKDSEGKMNKLYQTICIKRDVNRLPSMLGLHYTDFLLPQASQRIVSLSHIHCSCCTRKLNENDLINNLICGHILCKVCLPRESCITCNPVEDSTYRRKSNVSNYTEDLNSEFQLIKLEFNSHIRKLIETSKSIREGWKTINTIATRYDERKIIDDIEVVRKEIARWEEELKNIENTVCRAKGPGKPHNTILLDEYEWTYRLSRINKYLHEILHLVKSGEKVYVMAIVMDRLKFGEFSFDGNHLFFYALARYTVEDEAYFAKLNDLKICAGDLFVPFITISYKNKESSPISEIRIFVRLYPNKISREFLDLCTGEEGTSYQYHSYVKGTFSSKWFKSILHVPMDPTISESEMFNVNELPFHSNVLELDKGNLFIIGSQNGSFSVCRALENGLKIKSFGQTIAEDKFYQINFRLSKDLKIANCGVQVFHF